MNNFDDVVREISEEKVNDAVVTAAAGAFTIACSAKPGRRSAHPQLRRFQNADSGIPEGGRRPRAECFWKTTRTSASIAAGRSPRRKLRPS